MLVLLAVACFPIDQQTTQKSKAMNKYSKKNESLQLKVSIIDKMLSELGDLDRRFRSFVTKSTYGKRKDSTGNSALALALTGLVIAGCASPATIEGMSSTPTATEQASMPEILRNHVGLGFVGGGEPTNPLWTSEVGNEEFREALRRSLRASGVLAADENAAAYLVEATLVGIEQPLVGFDTTVTSTVDYRVSPRSGEGRTMQTVVTQPYTATVGDAFLAVERLRLANEGSVRENIGEFVRQMIEFYNQ